MASPGAKQFAEGARAGINIRGGKQVKAYAIDSAGKEHPLYVEHLTPEEENRGLEPRYYCPSCGNALIGTKSANSSTDYRPMTCSNCGVQSTRQESMPSGIGLIMA
jgi:predicted RNA-binding Zn-ribbon protein involved in translation (DUF1610 family)